KKDCCCGAGDKRPLLDNLQPFEYLSHDSSILCVVRNYDLAGPSYSMPSVAFPDRTKPIGRDCSSLTCAIRLAVRARIGTPFSAVTGKPASSRTAAIAPETLIGKARPNASGTNFSSV